MGRKNSIEVHRDTYGNLYLTKGSVEKGEYYPCLTAHLDTVQHLQELYAVTGTPLPIKERTTEKGQEWYCENTGIGADDKAGVVIALSLFKYFDALKACFFLEEEVVCRGSHHLDKGWFEDVGYVIGWDSPERNRSAYACGGELLFSKDFYEKVKETCERNGLTNFRNEPFTDVMLIRQLTGVMCMNNGNGGYNAHQKTEYVVVEEMDEAIGLGIDLIKLLGKERYTMPSKNLWEIETLDLNDEDVKYFNQFFF